MELEENAPNLTRRDALAGGSALVAAAAISPALAKPGRKPNVIFIMADDLGAFDLSCYGRPDYKTPHIDSLANDGMKFSLAYANSSTCAPTRVALISGRYQNRVPIGLTVGGGVGDRGYDGSLPSLPRYLKQAGYGTALVGKWDLGHLPNFSPVKSGYDEFFGVMGGTADYWTHDFGLPNGKREHDLYENETPVDSEGYLTDLFSDRAVDIISRYRDRPFFLSLHYNAPHFPWQTRSDRAENRRNDIHYDGGSPAIYAEMVRSMDEGVGRVLAALDEFALARDTIVIFTSDNGGERFSHMWPLRGEKGSLWEGGVRIPQLVRWPGRIAAGTTTDQVTLSMDWLPTLCRIAGTETDPSYAPDGMDIMPQMFGSAPIPREVFWRVAADQSALSYPWKYLQQSEHEYLYNLAEDASEQANLKLRHPEQVARLKAALSAWSDTMLPASPAIDWGLIDYLEALEAPPPPVR